MTNNNKKNLHGMCNSAVPLSPGSPLSPLSEEARLATKEINKLLL